MIELSRKDFYLLQKCVCFAQNEVENGYIMNGLKIIDRDLQIRLYKIQNKLKEVEHNKIICIGIKDN